MSIRSTFLNRIVIAALTSPLVGHSAFAQQYQSGNWAQNAADAVNADYKNYQKIENFIIQSPMSSLDNLVKMANKDQKYHGPEAPTDIRLFLLNVKYSKDLPAGQVSSVDLTEGPQNKVLMTITAHEKARTNPFVLLESLINLNELYSLSSISANTMTLKPDGNVDHHGYQAYSNAYFNIANSLGVTGVDKKAKYSHHHHGAKITVAASPSAIEFAELRANADAGSVISQRRIAELDIKTFQAVKKSFVNFLPIKNMDEAQKQSALLEYAQLKGLQISSGSYEVMLQSLQDQMDLRNKRKLDTLNIAAKKVYKQQIDEYKAGAAEREQVVQGTSLSDMVKANDRAGVADAMDKMLPWSIMEPTEKVFWHDYVDAIRNPNYDGAPILFRGLDPGEKLQAITDIKGNVIGSGIFSKRLTAGSGSHLFKLKGLPETFETFGTDGVNQRKSISPLNQPHTLTKMMLNHAGNPQGSPFISLTYDPQVAYNFSDGGTLNVADETELAKKTPAFLNSNASGGLATIRMDKRRLVTNSVSGFANEVEVLASMLIFPDEVLLLEKGLNYGVNFQGPEYNFKPVKRMTLDEYYAKARSVVYQKTGVVMPRTHEEVKNQGEKAFFDGLKDMEARLRRVNPNAPMMCSKVFQ